MAEPGHVGIFLSPDDVDDDFEECQQEENRKNLYLYEVSLEINTTVFYILGVRQRNMYYSQSLSTFISVPVQAEVFNAKFHYRTCSIFMR